MPRKLGVIVVHGIGWQGPGFAEPMIVEVERRLTALGHDPAEVAWQPVHWAPVTESRQREYLGEARRDHDLDWLGLRRFIVSAIGDAGAYQKVHSEANAHAAYDKIHACVARGMAELAAEVVDGSPLVVMAHSLGAHIMSNYIWDVQRDAPRGLLPSGQGAFERMETLCGILTFGANIPLFTFAWPRVEPIAFPPPQLPDELKAKARWINFYDPDDILGYPLRPISDGYAEVVSEDRAINVGGIFASWNPACHLGYWTDDDFTRPAAELIAEFL